MSEIAKYEAYKKKLQGVCDENNLVFRFRQDTYPITLIIRPVTGLDEQLCMLESVEENGYTSPDASIMFTIKDGALTYKTSETFTISDALFSKVKNLFKNLHYCWLQFFFRDLLEKNVLTEKTMPTIGEKETAMRPDGCEPLEVEDFEDSEDVELADEMDADDNADDGPEDAEEYQEFLQQAIDLVREEGTASLTLLQRRLGVGRTKATHLMADMESLGVVGPKCGEAPREVLHFDAAEDAKDGGMAEK